MNTPIHKAIITGAKGFIGQALARRLQERNIPVMGIDMETDIRKPGVLNPRLDEHTTVFHLAGSANVPKSVENPREDFEHNLLGFFEVLESVRQARAKLIFPSTASVFDPKNPVPFAETATKNPSSPYGASKLAAESYCRVYHRNYGLDVRVARLFSVYGEGMRRFAIYDFFEKIKNDPNDLVIFGDGQQLRDYLHISDAVDALLLIAENGLPGEDYQVGSGEPTKILDLAKKVAQYMEVPDIKIHLQGDERPSEVPRWYADISKIKKIGFSPRVSLDQGLQRTIRHFRDNA